MKTSKNPNWAKQIQDVIITPMPNKNSKDDHPGKVIQSLGTSYIIKYPSTIASLLFMSLASSIETCTTILKYDKQLHEDIKRGIMDLAACTK